MKFGVCYYPEQWPSDRWKTDFQLMNQAGISIVRLGEFAWSAIEPSPQSYQWEWLDNVIQASETFQIDVVLCTPTAAPPAWLIQNHPEILPVDQEGRSRRFGSRRHYCPNNPTFQEHTGLIVEALARRYGTNSDVIAWQIDNEFACYLPRCYCPVCVEKFQSWLHLKYREIDNLNQAWGNSFWSQTYASWEQIEPPILTVAEPNPSHTLDYYKFFSECWVAYQQLQIESLRKHISTVQRITHNIIASQTDIDYYHLAENLDFISWDSYPTGYAEILESLIAENFTSPFPYAPDLGNPDITGYFHSLTRGLKQIPFWVMEQQTGQINWSSYNTGVLPGALRLWTWQACASGAEAVVYFRWRASRFGFEQFHAGLLKHDGESDQGYKELLDLKKEVPLMNELESDPVKNKIAIIFNYNYLWSLDLQPHRHGFSYLKLSFLYYWALRNLGIESDLVNPYADLSQYSLVIAPSLVIGDDILAGQLFNFADRGGTLIAGIRSGMKTDTNLATEIGLPGVYQNLLGTLVNEWHSLLPDIGYDLSSTTISIKGQATTWAESLIPTRNAQSVIDYDSLPFVGFSALTKNPVGKGSVYHLGWYPSLEQAICILDNICDGIGLEVTDQLKPGLFQISRGSKRIIFNFTNSPKEFKYQDLTYQIPARDLLLIQSGDELNDVKEKSL